MHPFHSLFTEEPETEYVPDTFGRIGQGGFVVKPDPEPIGTPSPRFDEFSKAEQSGLGLSDLFGANPFAIKGPVGPFGSNRRADVGKVETFMSRSGNFDLSPTDGPTGYYGLRLEDAINAFQKANGLKPDGLLNPRGKTIRTLAGKLKDQIKPPTPPAPQPKPANPLTLSAQGAGQENAQLKHTGGVGGIGPNVPAPAHPQIAERTPPPTGKDPLEDFKKADRESMRPINRLNAGLDKIEERIKGIEERGKEFGLVLAPRALRHFRKGSGRTMRVKRDWLRKREPIRVAERRVQGHFENWITGKKRPSPDAPSERIIEALLTLKDGGKLNRKSKWEALVRVPFLRRPISDLFNAAGGSKIESTGSFRFVRQGNKILVLGRVDHRWFNRYHWQKGKSALLLDGSRFRHDDALKLQKHRGAKPFDMESKWSQTVIGTISVREDKATGRLVITGVDLKWKEPEEGRAP